MTAANKAQRILAFCRWHDWGDGAYLDGDKVCGLLERWTDQAYPGQLFEEEISLPLDIKTIRDWAGY